MGRRWTDEQFINAVRKSFSVRNVLILLGLAPWGANYKMFERESSRLGVPTDHFLGQAARRSLGRSWPSANKRSTESILVENSAEIVSNRLRKRLIKERILEPVCGVCGLREWNNLPMPLELEHVNGDSTDNRIENLKLLCPNCHAQTPTYRGRNIGKRIKKSEWRD